MIQAVGRVETTIPSSATAIQECTQKFTNAILWPASWNWLGEEVIASTSEHGGTFQPTVLRSRAKVRPLQIYADCGTEGLE